MGRLLPHKQPFLLMQEFRIQNAECRKQSIPTAYCLIAYIHSLFFILNSSFFILNDDPFLHLVSWTLTVPSFRPLRSHYDHLPLMLN